MIVQASHLFEADGTTKQSYAYCLSGRQQVQKPLLGLHLIQQQLHVFEPVTIQERVSAGVYITFNTGGASRKAQGASAAQIIAVYEDTQVDWEVAHEAQFNWLQLYISWHQLAAITGENEQQVKAFFKRYVSNITGTPLTLSLTTVLNHEFSLLTQREGKQLALVGKLYNVILLTLEHLQIQHHIHQCDDCQKKLYNSQNIIEAEQFSSSEALAKQVGLTQTALELGFSVITGMSIAEYQIEVAFRKVLAQPQLGQSLATRLTTETGWTQQDIEKACLKRFGVMSHQLGSMQ